MTSSPIGPEVQCRDEVFVNSVPEAVYDILADLRTYEKWWTLMRVRPLTDPDVRPGTRWVFEGSRPGGRTSNWTVEVVATDRPNGIELAYIDGDLLGRVAWELRPANGGTVVAYVYRSVQAAHPASAETFRRYGTRLHSVAMQADALAGLVRYAEGHELGADWRDDVLSRVDAGIQGLSSSA